METNTCNGFDVPCRKEYGNRGNLYVVTGTNNEISNALAKCRENTCAGMPLNAAFSCAAILHCDWSWMAHMFIRCNYHKFEDDPWIVHDTL